MQVCAFGVTFAHSLALAIGAGPASDDAEKDEPTRAAECVNSPRETGRRGRLDRLRADPV